MASDTGDAEGFWQSVQTNLQAGRVWLVFVVDEVPRSCAGWWNF